jgi:hypothetical protein
VKKEGSGQGLKATVGCFGKVKVDKGDKGDKYEMKKVKDTSRIALLNMKEDLQKARNLNMGLDYRCVRFAIAASLYEQIV